MRSIGIRLAIVAIIVVGGFILRDRLSSSAGDLQVGDCFDDTPGATVESVQHHPCSEGHTAEAFLVTDLPAADNAPIPTNATLSAFVAGTCGPALISYAGGDQAVTANPVFSNIDIGLFYPSDEDWGRGERKVTCYAYSVDGSPLTTSLKAAAQ